MALSMVGAVIAGIPHTALHFLTADHHFGRYLFGTEVAMHRDIARPPAAGCRESITRNRIWSGADLE
jgi:hypothetical protein